MDDRNAKIFLEQIREVVKSELALSTSGYVKILPARIISFSSDNKTAEVQPISGGASFFVPIVTPQTVEEGDYVNLAYWGNLSTAVLFSK